MPEPAGQAAPEPAERPRAQAVPRRRDSRITYESLVAAVGRLLDQDQHRSFNLAQVAAEADVSIATAYRYFGSTGQLIDAYLDDFVAELEVHRGRRPARERRGRLGLQTLGEDWVAIVLARGWAMVHGRRLGGLLRRHRDRNRDIQRIWRVYAEPTESPLIELGADPGELEFAVLLWNAIFYTREVLDLHETLGWPADRIAERLTAAFVAAITPRAAA